MIKVTVEFTKDELNAVLERVPKSGRIYWVDNDLYTQTDGSFGPMQDPVEQQSIVCMYEAFARVLEDN